MMIAHKLAVLLIQNFSETVQNVRQGMSYAVSAMGNLLKAARWWQVLAAAVGGFVVGGIVWGVARGLGALRELRLRLESGLGS